MTHNDLKRLIQHLNFDREYLANIKKTDGAEQMYKMQCAFVCAFKKIKSDELQSLDYLKD